MCERRDNLDAVKSVVVIVVMHLEVVKLQLLLRHRLLRLVDLSVQVLHYVPYIHTTCTPTLHTAADSSITASVDLFQVYLENES